MQLLANMLSHVEGEVSINRLSIVTSCSAELVLHIWLVLVEISSLCDIFILTKDINNKGSKF